MRSANNWTIIVIIFTILSHLCRIFKTVYLNQSVFLGHIKLHLIFGYNMWYIPFPMLNVLYFTLVLREVPNMAVFCRSLMWFFPGYVAQVFSEWFWDGSSCFYYYWNHISFTFHMCCISVVRSLYFQIFRFLSLWHCYNLKLQHLLKHVLSSLSRIVISGLLSGTVLSNAFFIP